MLPLRSQITTTNPCLRVKDTATAHRSRSCMLPYDAPRMPAHGPAGQAQHKRNESVDILVSIRMT